MSMIFVTIGGPVLPNSGGTSLKQTLQEPVASAFSGENFEKNNVFSSIPSSLFRKKLNPH